LEGSQFVAFVDQRGPDFLHHTVLVPPLKPAVNRAVVAKLWEDDSTGIRSSCRKTIPLNA
jgi:hypothetical protein